MMTPPRFTLSIRSRFVSLGGGRIGDVGGGRLVAMVSRGSDGCDGTSGGVAPGTTRPPIGVDGMWLKFVSRTLPGGKVPGGDVEKAPVSGNSPGNGHGMVGSVPAMKNSVASTPGHPSTHWVFVSRSTVLVTMPAGRGQSGGDGLRR